MGWSEKRGGFWRARWTAPNGKVESMSGFLKKTAADQFWQDQESAIRAHRYVDPKAGQILFEDYVNLWYPSLNLEHSTMANYRYHLEHHILPTFQGRSLAAVAQSREEIDTWEKELVQVHGYAPRTARDARTTLATCLNGAIPHRIQFNPAEREKAKGKRGLRRIERAQAKQKAKDVPTPLEVLLFGERLSAISGRDDDLVRELLYAFGGARWGEPLALGPDYLTEEGKLDIAHKLYELGGHFYRGIPKDGSLRELDLPPFLLDLLGELKPRRCTCRPRARRPGDPDWCTGREYLILGPDGGHPRRNNYGQRFIRPAADGWWPGRGGKDARPSLPVLVDLSKGWPGVPVNPWPIADEGIEFDPPPPIVERGRAHKRLPPGTPVAVWLPIRKGLTTHWLRHTQQTWMAEDRIPDILRDERMGHYVQDHERVKGLMRDHYTHGTELMRDSVVETQQQRWEAALMQRAELERYWSKFGIPRRSSVSLMDRLLEPYRAKSVSSLTTPLIPRLGGRRRSGKISKAG